MKGHTSYDYLVVTMGSDAAVHFPWIMMAIDSLAFSAPLPSHCCSCDCRARHVTHTQGAIRIAGKGTAASTTYACWPDGFVYIIGQSPRYMLVYLLHYLPDCRLSTKLYE